MACPFFVPREILNDGSWPHPSRLPLGAGWRGDCCALNRTATPTDSEVRDFCNLGYATGCPRLPGDRDWDAVRFSVARACTDEITIQYVCELRHAPVEHGKLTFDLVQHSWREAHADARVRRLAESYVHACRVRREGTLIK